MYDVTVAASAKRSRSRIRRGRRSRAPAPARGPAGRAPGEHGAWRSWTGTFLRRDSLPPLSMPGVRSSGGGPPYAIARANLFTGALMRPWHARTEGAHDRAVTGMRVALGGALCATLLLALAPVALT